MRSYPFKFLSDDGNRTVWTAEDFLTKDPEAKEWRVDGKLHPSTYSFYFSQAARGGTDRDARQL